MQYYRIARTDARYEVVGAYPFSPEIIKKQSRFPYYKFTSRNGKLQQIECYKGQFLQIDDKYFETVQIRYQRTPANPPLPALEIHVFLDANGDPMGKEDGVFAERLTLNNHGQCVRITNLDADNQPMMDGMGIVHYVRTVDTEGRVVSTSFEDARHKRIFDNQGHYEIRSSYNKEGFRITKKNYGPDGSLLEDRSGIAITRWKHDDLGNVIQESYFDKDDKPTLRNGAGPHRVDYTYDDNGNIIKEEYFDSRKDIITDETHNVAEIMRKFDANGNILEVAFADTEGFLTRSSVTGYAAERFTYNERGDITQRTTANERGRPIRDPAIGAATERILYYPDGRTQSRRFFDESDHLVELPLYNAAIILYEYLPNGSTRISFLDRNSIRCEHELFGFSIMEQPGPYGGRLVFFDTQE
ncbi:MAG TPA: hypothetical protein VK970_06385, partial [Candidatus Methylacidiphilales bacterium]|nr:hypothetical protein [Candidatus Methylacidiphilales bacterium]